MIFFCFNSRATETLLPSISVVVVVVDCFYPRVSCPLPLALCRIVLFDFGLVWWLNEKWNRYTTGTKRNNNSNPHALIGWLDRQFCSRDWTHASIKELRQWLNLVHIDILSLSCLWLLSLPSDNVWHELQRGSHMNVARNTKKPREKRKSRLCGAVQGSGQNSRVGSDWSSWPDPARPDPWYFEYFLTRRDPTREFLEASWTDPGHK